MSPAVAIKYDLPGLLALARAHNPGLEAARKAVEGFEGRLTEARFAWLQGTFQGLLAPAPGIHCQPSETNCLRTDTRVPGLSSISGVFTRVDLNVALPIYTWGKLTNARRAAEAGVKIGHQQVRIARMQLELEVRRAYYGLKLAREALLTIAEGKGHLETAIKSIEKQLDQGKGGVTLPDMLRLKAFLAEVLARELEAKRLQALALSGMKVLTGVEHALEVDDRPLEPAPVKLASLQYYMTVASLNRPEARVLSAGVEARRANVAIERGKFFPDLALAGFFSYAFTSSVDFPQNAFFSNPYNTLSGGVGLALKLDLDYGLKVGRLKRARAELEELEANRRLALSGIKLEVEKAYREVTEAHERLAITQKGTRAARSWLVAQVQSLAAGLVEAKDLSDALLAFFTLRLREFQAMYDLNIALATLARAAGEPIPGEPG
jgi:outer membrane protein TolC